MSEGDAWKWLRNTRAMTAEERAYSERVRANKRKAANRRRNQRTTADRREAKRKNDAPLY